MLRLVLTCLLFIILGTPLLAQLPPYSECLNEGDADIGLDRKAWTSNVGDVSESYQLNFQVPDVAPYECVKIERIEFIVTGFSDNNNITPPECYLFNYTNIVDCNSSAPISCDWLGEEQGVNNITLINDGDLYNGQFIGYDIVIVNDLNNPACSPNIISDGDYDASFSVCMEVYYENDEPEDPIDFDDDEIEICEGNTYDLEGPNGYVEYEWDGPLNSQDQDLLDAVPGLYSLTVTDDVGCTSVDFIEIVPIEAFDVDFVQNDPHNICSSSSESLQVLINNATNYSDYTFDWLLPDGSTSSNTSLVPTVAGIYNLNVINNDSDCEVNASILVNILQLSTAQIDSLSSRDTLICDNTINLNAFIPYKDLENYSFQWIDGLDTIRTQNITIDSPGDYVLNLLNDKNCPITSDTITVRQGAKELAGDNNSDTTCSGVSYNLDNLLNGNTTTSGQWTDLSNTGALSGGTFNTTGLSGSFTFRYTVTNTPPCQDDVAEFILEVSGAIENDVMEDLCSGESRTINGTVYDAANDEGTETFQSSNGCDSLVTYKFTFTNAIENTVEDELCEGQSTTINGTVYDAANDEGMETYQSANGCDSIVTYRFTFVTAIENTIEDELCEGQSTTINGTVYDAANDEGMETYQSANGCDSIVTYRFTFVSAVENTIEDELCEGQSTTINGTVYDAANDEGMETYQSTNGCDSIVTYRFTFVTAIETTLDIELCEGDSETINGITYDENNLTGMTPFQSVNGCDSIVFVEVTNILNSPATTTTESFCEGDSIMIQGDWISVAGLVLDTLQNTVGCDSIIETTVEMIPCDITVGLNFGDIECFGQETGFIEFNATSNSYPIFYELIGINASGQIDDSGFILINNLAAGDYLLVISDADGDVLYDEDFILVEPDEIEIGLSLIDEIICASESNGSIMAIGTGGSGSLQYSWSTGKNGDFIDGLSTGDYTVTVLDENNCSQEESISLTEPEAINYELTRVNIACGESQTGIINIENLTGGNGTYTSSINGGNFEDKITYTDLEEGMYNIVVMDENNCSLTQSISIVSESSQSLSPIPNETINEGESVTLNLSLSFTATSIQWSPSEGLSCTDCEAPEASPLNTTTYIVTILDDEGCSVETSVLVTVIPVQVEVGDVYIPNTFDPNSTGVNSLFKPFSADPNSTTTLKVFDRWGNLLHEEFGNDITGWNGTYNDIDVEAGVYIYIMEYQSGEDTIMKTGELTLLR